ncbi:hypothetical protein COOONC_25020 [Cooperia oncophora]
MVSRCGYPSPRFTNLPDHFMKVLSKDDDISEEDYNNKIKNLVESYETSEEEKIVHRVTHAFVVTSSEMRGKLNIGDGARYSASWIAQLWWLFIRSSKIMARDWQGFFTRLIKTIVSHLPTYHT